jgi:hypothetical protein
MLTHQQAPAAGEATVRRPNRNLARSSVVRADGPTMVGVPTSRVRRQTTRVQVDDYFPSADEVIGERIASRLTNEVVAHVREEST